MKTDRDASDVTAIVTTLGRNQARLDRCIASLRASRNVEPFPILVILNDPSVHLTLPSEVVVLTPGLNLGNVGGLEYGRTLSNSEFIWMIQDDMEVEEFCLSQLKRRLATEPDLALVSPVVVRDGVVPAFSRGGTFSDENATIAFYPSKDCAPEALSGTSKLDYVTCSGGLVRANVLDQVGGFNLKLYPLLYGDVDLCLNIRAAGWKFDLEGKAHISHERNGSTPNLLLRTLKIANEKAIQDKLRGIDAEIAISPDVDPRIISAVAQRASFLFLEVSNAGQSELNKYENNFLIKAIRKVIRLISRIMRRIA